MTSGAHLSFREVRLQSEDGGGCEALHVDSLCRFGCGALRLTLRNLEVLDLGARVLSECAQRLLMRRGEAAREW